MLKNPISTTLTGISQDVYKRQLQRDHLFEWRSILSNVSLGLEIQRKKDAAHIGRVHELLDLYGLKGFKSSRPSELSGGMRQRAALIRTLALDPDILMLDEPFSACLLYTSRCV